MPSNGCMEEGYCSWLYYCSEAEAYMTTGNDDNKTSGCCNPTRKVRAIASDEYSEQATHAPAHPSPPHSSPASPPLHPVPLIHSLSPHPRAWHLHARRAGAHARTRTSSPTSKCPRADPRADASSIVPPTPSGKAAVTPASIGYGFMWKKAPS